jgi:formylglycine-generating enzyme required for sulfatase activity
VEELREYAWVAPNPSRTLHPVGSRLPNAFGLYDMHGSVWEWCADTFITYREWLRSAEDGVLVDPLHEGESTSRIVRGGQTVEPAEHARSAHRSHAPQDQGSGYGIRLMATIRLPSATTGETSRVTPPRAVAPFTPEKAKQHQAAWAEHLDVSVEIENSIGINLRIIPPGEFLMGYADDETDRLIGTLEQEIHPNFFDNAKQQLLSAQTQHRVTLTHPFAISRHEVTRGQFRRFVEASGYSPQYQDDWLIEKVGSEEQTDQHPVLSVSWYDAVAFCEWLSQQEGVLYRLPTAAEWDFACWAGTAEHRVLPEDLERAAWFMTNSLSGPRVVGQKEANPFGLHDMLGNVYEWCLDTHASYSSAAQTDPVGPSYIGIREFRGGSFQDPAVLVGTACRGWSYGGGHAVYVGFRIVRDFETDYSKLIRSDREYFTAIGELGGEVRFVPHPSESELSAAVRDASEPTGNTRRLVHPQRLSETQDLMKSAGVYLTFAGESFGDEELQRAADLIRRRPYDSFPISLILTQPSISAEGLQSLAGLPIHALTISDVELTPAGADAIGRIGVHQTMTLHNVGLDDVGLESLVKNAPFIWLHVPGNQLTTRGLQSLVGSKLTVLNISDNNLSDDDLVILEELPLLNALYLDGNPVSDAALAHVKALPKLTFLHLQRTGVTETGIQDLHESLPKCQIIWDGGTVQPKAADGGADSTDP